MAVITSDFLAGLFTNFRVIWQDAFLAAAANNPYDRYCTVVPSGTDTESYNWLGTVPKMREWIANGAELGWLIDPDNQIVEVYRQGREPEILVGRKSIKGEGQIAGFVLDLRTIWNPVDTRPDF